MMGRKKATSGSPIEGELPRALRQGIMRIMLENNLDWEPACEVAATLLDRNSQEFKSAVDRRANTEYKSRHMTEMNKTLATKEAESERRVNEAYQKGSDDGYARGRSDYEIKVPCVVCRKPFHIPPNSEAHQLVVNLFNERKWVHGECIKKNS